MNSAGHFHAVRFYRTSDDLCRLVAGFLADGFEQGQPAIVIATEEHRAGIERQLADRALDASALQAAGGLTMLDAEETLGQFMVDGVPAADRFRDAIVPIIERVCSGRPECAVRAYGEMVDVLWKAGQPAAATQLEAVWNTLADTHAFSLLCGYATENLYQNSAVEEICSHHSHVISASGALAAIN
jgi:hypothetical protein